MNILPYSRAKKSVPILIFVKIGIKVDLIIPNSMITFVWTVNNSFSWFYFFNVKTYSEFALICTSLDSATFGNSILKALSRLHFALQTLQIHYKLWL